MMFEDLHDPDPPEVGLRELAIVAERARAIRRRRARIGVRTMGVLTAGVAAVAVASAYSTDGDDVVELERPPATFPAAIVDELVVAPQQVPLTDAAAITGLSPIEVNGPRALTARAGAIELRLVESGDGRVCVSVVGVADVGCADQGVGMYVGELDGVTVGGADENNPAPTVVIIVDDTVTINFVTVGAACTPAVADPPSVRVWVCDGLDIDRARAEVRGDDLVVVSTESER